MRRGALKFPRAVTLKEVGPRDGLQNEVSILPTEKKVEFVNRLSSAGLKHIEVSSFVNPKWIPALSDAVDVFAGIERHSDVEYSALVPNARGLERAFLAKVDAVNVFMSASETHNRKNINKSINDTYSVLSAVVHEAKSAGLPVRGYISTVFGCPYEGPVSISQILSVTERLFAMGIDELSLGDTIGVAVPPQVNEIVQAVMTLASPNRLALHFHDTRGTAIANIVSGMSMGISIFDTSIGGLGGCPYAPGASGNVATDDVLYLLEQMGVRTDVDPVQLDATAEWLEGVIGKPLPSHARTIHRRGRS